MKVPLLAPLLLLLAGACSTHQPYQASVYSKDACEILAKKRQAKPVGDSRHFRRAQKNRDNPTQLSDNSKSVKDRTVSGDLPTVFIVPAGEPRIPELKFAPVEREDLVADSEDEFHLTVRDNTTTDNQEVKTVQAESREPAYPGFKRSAFSFLILSLVGFGALGLLRLFERSFMQITRWGKQNPKATRALITLAHIIIGTSALYVGDALYKEGVLIPYWAQAAAASTFALAAGFYPRGFSGSIPMFSYARRKAHDLVLVTTGTMIMVSAANNYELTTRYIAPERAVISEDIPVSSTTHVTLAKRDKSFFRGIFKNKEGNGRVGKIVLVSILFAILSLGVTALACSIACSGSEALAVILGVGLEFLLIWGLVAAIRSINKGKHEEQPVAPTP